MHLDTIYWVTWTLLGTIVGSFLNAFIHRWPRRISLLTRTRSFCPKCDKDIAWYDNIPIISYLFLLGRCRRCRNRIPVRYLVVELLTAAFFSLAFYQGRIADPEHLGWPFVLLASLVVADLLALAFVDIETYTVPFVNSLSLMIIGLVLAPAWGRFQHLPTVWSDITRLDAWLNSLQGLILGGGLVWAIGAAAELILRKEAMGGGDVKILAGVGALFGWKAAVVGLLVAVFAGAIIGILMILVDKFMVTLRQGRIGVKGIEEGITYKYEADEEPPPTDEQIVKRHTLMLIGTVVALEQIACAYLMPGARRSLLSAVPFMFGASIGFFAIFYDIVRRRLVNEGRWIQRDIVTDSEGATEEKLSGHYLPFGPFLAASAIVMLFAGKSVITLATRWFFPMF